MARTNVRLDSTEEDILDDILDEPCDCDECSPGLFGIGLPVRLAEVTITINGIPVLRLERSTVGSGH